MFLMLSFFGCSVGRFADCAAGSIAAEQIHAKEAVLGSAKNVSHRAIVRCRRSGVMLCEHTAHDILVDRDAERMRNVLDAEHAAETDYALHVDDGRDEFARPALRPGSRRACGAGKQQAIFPIRQNLVDRSR